MNFLSQKKPVEVSSDPEPPTEEDESDDDLLDQEPAVAAHLGYVPDDEPLEDLADDDPVESSSEADYELIMVASKERVRRKLDIPVLKARENVRKECRKWLQQALDDIEKLIKSIGMVTVTVYGYGRILYSQCTVTARHRTSPYHVGQLALPVRSRLYVRQSYGLLRVRVAEL